MTRDEWLRALGYSDTELAFVNQASRATFWTAEERLLRLVDALADDELANSAANGQDGILLRWIENGRVRMLRMKERAARMGGIEYHRRLIFEAIKEAKP